MAKGSEANGGLEWRINMPDGLSKILVPESMPRSRICGALQRFIMGFLSKFWGFIQEAWKLGVSDPKKFIHCIKVGLALCLVSLFYYMRPLYHGVGGNAMWAVMTVVVVFEYTVGATLCKCVNRATGTCLAGALGVGVHWIASQSAAAATFSRFIPSVKARFDYGAMIFILTFSLVSVSGYRVEKLFELAHHRLSTITIGTSICIITTMLFFPVWAGNDLHDLIKNNIEKLADSLDGCVADYFSDDANGNDIKNEASNKILLVLRLPRNPWLILLDGSLHMEASNLDTHGKNTSSLELHSGAVPTALKPLTVASIQTQRLRISLRRNSASSA